MPVTAGSFVFLILFFGIGFYIIHVYQPYRLCWSVLATIIRQLRGVGKLEDVESADSAT
jgi:hypothetical protein